MMEMKMKLQQLEKENKRLKDYVREILIENERSREASRRGKNEIERLKMELQAQQNRCAGLEKENQKLVSQTFLFL